MSELLPPVPADAPPPTPREADRGGLCARPRPRQPPPRATPAVVNQDPQVKAWWHVSAVNATRRLGMSDHSWVHIQIVLNIGLRLSRLLLRRGVIPSVVANAA